MSDLEAALVGYLPRQRWYGLGDVQPASVAVVDRERLVAGLPGLLWALVDATFDDGSRSRYQVVLGLREPGGREDFLDGKPYAVVGELDLDGEDAYAYDAVYDPHLAPALLRHVAGEDATIARALLVEQSNSAVIFDERFFMKLFRRIADGPNPDAEMIEALAATGFDAVAQPVARWHDDGADLALVTEYLAGGVEGWQLALTSLRDLYDARCEPSEAGGDFAFDARRLGDITGRMHVALDAAFGHAAGERTAWVEAMHAQLDRTAASAGLDDRDRDRVAAVYERFNRLADVGTEIRIHGDLHLGQMLRTDTGWYVLDFEGEPARPVAERRRPASPLRDVAGMLRSFHYASQVGLAERAEEADEELAVLARRWEERNAGAFLDGYLAVDGVDALLPGEAAAREEVLVAFQLDKAVYELAYEAAHRPDWARIPVAALHSLLEHVE